MPRRARPSEVLPITPAKTLTSLLASCKKAKTKTDAINSDVREEIAAAVATKHLHRGAFATIRRMHALSDEKLAEEYYHLMAYFDSSGIAARVERIGRLDLGDNPPALVQLQPAE